MVTNFDTERITINDARGELPKLAKQLTGLHKAMAITRYGEPVLAVMPWELFEAITETLEIMGDPEMMAALRQGIKDVQEGRLVPLEEIEARLGLDSSG